MQDVLDEFEGNVLPDARLCRRLRSMVGQAWKDPAASFPEMLENAASLEGGYRLFNNRSVTFGRLHAPHKARTIERAEECGDVVVIADTTDVETPYADASEVGYLQTGRVGYKLHVSLAVDVRPNRAPRPLGVLSAQPIFGGSPPSSRGKKKKKKLSGGATARLKDKRSMRWDQGIDASAEALENCASVIHVADREADNYRLFCRILEHGHGCVIRLRNDRKARPAQDEDDIDDEWSLLSEIATETTGVFERTVPLSKRGDKGPPAQLKTHPPRESRSAKLQYSAVEVVMKRPNYLPGLPDSLNLWMVCVWEPEPPEGEKAVNWTLLTTESCQSPGEILRAVDLYRARWMIEDYFKALKTGCAIQTRQLESRHALLNALAVFLPIAVHLLWIRCCARDTPDAPATEVFTPLQLTVLRHRSHRRMPDRPTAMQALWALAGIGGHIKNNGWPGWQVLGRAFAKLLEAVAVWKLAMNARLMRAEM
jgi:hypothetical protein